jgi:hypothetical protein
MPASQAALWKFLLRGTPRTLDEMFISSRAVHVLGSLTVLAFTDKQGNTFEQFDALSVLIYYFFIRTIMHCGGDFLLGLLCYPRPVPESLSFFTPRVPKQDDIMSPASNRLADGTSELVSLDVLQDSSSDTGITLCFLSFLTCRYSFCFSGLARPPSVSYANRYSCRDVNN